MMRSTGLRGVFINFSSAPSTPARAMKGKAPFKSFAFLAQKIPSLAPNLAVTLL
jgi:hypothetical protein